jgi:hypothetical protein
MKVYHDDSVETSIALAPGKGQQTPDILSEMCPVCGKSVQVIGGKMSKHRCGVEDTKTPGM